MRNVYEGVAGRVDVLRPGELVGFLQEIPVHVAEEGPAGAGTLHEHGGGGKLFLHVIGGVVPAQDLPTSFLDTLIAQVFNGWVEVGRGILADRSGDCRRKGFAGHGVRTLGVDGQGEVPVS